MRFLTILSSTAFAIGALTSCQTSNTAPLAGTISSNVKESDEMMQKVEKLKAAGKTGKAAKVCEKMAKKYPFDPQAAKARKEQGELLEISGRPLKAFEAYQKLITRYPGSQYYNTVLERQKILAQATAEGQIKNNFLGMKSPIDLGKTVDMLTKVRDNAPRAASAPQAQFTIGNLYQSKKNHRKAIKSYNKLIRDHPTSEYAGEGMYRIGQIYLDQSKQGNQDSANLGRAREAFQDFLRNHPNHPKSKEAKQAVAQLDSNGIAKNFEVAEFYHAKGQPQSAIFYYKEVTRLTKSGDLYNRSKARLAELGAQ